MMKCLFARCKPVMLMNKSLTYFRRQVSGNLLCLRAKFNQAVAVVYFPSVINQYMLVLSYVFTLKCILFRKSYAN